MSVLGEEFGRLGELFEARVYEADWEALAERERLDVRAVLLDLEGLLAKQLAGVDVSTEVNLCKATLLQWRSAALTRVRVAVVEALKDLAAELAEVAVRVAVGLVA